MVLPNGPRPTNTPAIHGAGTAAGTYHSILAFLPYHSVLSLCMPGPSCNHAYLLPVFIRQTKLSAGPSEHAIAVRQHVPLWPQVGAQIAATSVHPAANAAVQTTAAATQDAEARTAAATAQALSLIHI